MITHFVGSPFRKFASFAWPVNVLKRSVAVGGVEAGLAAVAVDDLRPDVRPSRCTRTCRCPACRPSELFCGCCALDREALELQRRKPVVHVDELVRHPRTAGTCRTRWSAGSSPRESHLAETSANLPSERTTPPSEPAMNWSGLPGTVTMRVLVGMDALGVVRIAVLGQVAPGRAAVGRQQHGAAVRLRVQLAVAERAAEVDDVRAPGRRVDEVVVPALRRCSSRCSAASSCR